MTRLLLPMLVAPISACLVIFSAAANDADLIAKGIYSATLTDSSGPSGTSPYNSVRDTTIIPAALGTSFGVAFRVRVSTLRGAATVPTTVTWRFPAVGLSNPKTGETSHVYSTKIDCLAVCQAGWTFKEPWELVPGVWEIEIAINNRLALKQLFMVVDP